MTPKELDRRLLQMVLEQSRKKRPTEKDSVPLLREFRAQIPGPIDIMYILESGKGQAQRVEDTLGAEHTANEYDPDTVDQDGTSWKGTVHTPLKGIPSTQRPLLLVDDAWNGGGTIRRANKYFHRQGYKQIWTLHFWGQIGRGSSIDREYGVTMGNPVLVSADLLMGYFNRVHHDRTVRY